jgi:hypothetical protein
VPQLVLILADFYTTPISSSAPTLQRLPALELLSARARRRPLSRDWRQWLAAEVCDADVAALPPAALSAAGWIDSPGSIHHWFATPVHFFAGLDSLHVHPAGLLRLTREVQEALVADFERVFAGSGYHLHATGRRDLLLAGPPADGVHSSDPARWLGADPSAGLPAGEGAPALRRLTAELEMWLHEHPINQARVAAGELPASALWLWGGGPSPARRPAALPQLFADDAFVEGLCRLCGGSVLPLPPGWPAVRAAPDSRAGAASEAIAVLPTVSPRGMEAWEEIEEHWLVPALADLRAGRLDAICLIAGERRYDLSRWGLARVWRQPRPWWEELR